VGQGYFGYVWGQVPIMAQQKWHCATGKVCKAEVANELVVGMVRQVWGNMWGWKGTRRLVAGKC